MTHICVGKLTIIGSDNNGLLPGQRLAIIWTNAGLLSIGPLGTNFSKILINMLSGKWRPFYLSLNVLKPSTHSKISAKTRIPFQYENLLQLQDHIYNGIPVLLRWHFILKLPALDHLILIIGIHTVTRYHQIASLGVIQYKMSSDQYRNSHCGDKTILRSSYFHSGISYNGKIFILNQVPDLHDSRTCEPSLSCWHHGSHLAM